LLFIKYTHDYPHAEGKELTLERSFASFGTAACVCCLVSSNFQFSFFFWRFSLDDVFRVKLSVDDAGGGKLNFLFGVFFLVKHSGWRRGRVENRYLRVIF
jgi:hypothetical protein